MLDLRPPHVVAQAAHLLAEAQHAAVVEAHDIRCPARR